MSAFTPDDIPAKVGGPMPHELPIQLRQLLVMVNGTRSVRELLSMGLRGVEPAALRLVQPVGAQQPVLVCIGAKPVDVIADQEGDLLPRAGFALAGPGVGGEKGVEFGPEIVIQVVFA